MEKEKHCCACGPKLAGPAWPGSSPELASGLAHTSRRALDQGVAVAALAAAQPTLACRWQGASGRWQGALARRGGLD
jgi:hypothetical protein